MTLNFNSFAGHTDWRLPNVRELQSIVDYERFLPSIDPIFDTGCTPGCSVLTCSCTGIANYWSSTSIAILPTDAWIVFFTDGGVINEPKSITQSVREVRGPL